MALRPFTGLEIDGFTLGTQLHKGGFATIWDVSHPDHTLPMVMKVPIITDGFDGPTIVGFEVEQMIMPKLTGPHVPKVIAIGDFAVMPYIVCERIQGHPLSDRFKDAPLPILNALAIGEQMAASVHDLHRQHVIHLDLKPENFITRADHCLVAIDFGLARHAKLPDLLAEEFEIPMGTYPYIAPEQVLYQRNDLRSDIYAIGAMLYELVTGRPPFGRPTRLADVKRRLWQKPIPPRAIIADCPAYVQEIIFRALETDPKDRYQSAAQLLFDLRHPSQVKITARGEKTTQESVSKRFKRWWRGRTIQSFDTPPLMTAQIEKAPIIMAAVDLSADMEALADRLLLSVKRMLIIQPDARIACVNVIKTKRIGLDPVRDAEGNHIHVTRLVALRDWASRLALTEERVTCAILENSDPAAALIDYARHNHVDHILIGARGSSSARRYLGSVSSQVVAEAPCSVSVIRLPQSEQAQETVPSAKEPFHPDA
jgi:eukaryotic-like serine/threonine-protein kinase